MQTITKALMFASTLLFASPSIGRANECEAQFPGEVIAVVSDDVLVTMVGEEKVSEFSLPIVGSFWRCIAMAAFPAQEMLFIEWHEGSAGTSSIFSRVTLLAFSVGSSGAVLKGGWTLVESLQGPNRTEYEVNRSFRLAEMDRSVEIIFAGEERVVVGAD